MQITIPKGTQTPKIIPIIAAADNPSVLLGPIILKPVNIKCHIGK